MKIEKTESTEKHALSKVVITPPWNWQRWKREWNKPQPCDRRESMLHSIFRDRPPDQELAEKVCLMLDIADNYYGREKIMDHANDVHVMGTELGKKDLAIRAFITLCNNFFHDGDYYVNFPFEEPVFSKLLWFFRRHMPGTDAITSNIHPSEASILGGKDQSKHYLKQAREFAREFAIIAWDFSKAREFTDISPDEIRRIHAHTQTHWQDVLDLMERLNLLDYLLHNPPGEERFIEMVDFVISKHVTNASPTNRLKNLRALVIESNSKLPDTLWLLFPQILPRETSHPVC